MKFAKLALIAAFVLGMAAMPGCGRNKPLTEQQKKALDDDMKKAIEVNKNAQPQ
ncbi:MAG TPA: hypothetical protein VFE62_12900 [Gemmataceae bacterium]|nr:hypothetical protein [Gemmataceae bacterium]